MTYMGGTLMGQMGGVVMAKLVIRRKTMVFKGASFLVIVRPQVPV